MPLFFESFLLEDIQLSEHVSLNGIVRINGSWLQVDKTTSILFRLNGLDHFQLKIYYLEHFWHPAKVMHWFLEEHVSVCPICKTYATDCRTIQPLLPDLFSVLKNQPTIRLKLFYL